MAVSIISFLGLAVSIYLVWLKLRDCRNLGIKCPRTSIAWAVVYMALQGFIAVYAAFGLVQNDPVSAIAMNIVLCLCVWVSMDRQFLAGRLRVLFGPHGRWPHHTAVQVVLILVAGVFAMLALEVPSNHDFSWVYPLCFLLEWALITAAMGGVFFVLQRIAAPTAFVIAVCYVIGLAEYFVITFKSMPITPGDLSALSTAAAVSSGYTYYISAYCLYGLCFMALGMLLCEVAALLRPQKPERSRKGVVKNLIAGALCILGIAAHVTCFDYYNTLNITVYTWRPLESYYRQGFLPTFITQLQTFKPTQPDDYSVDGAEELLAEYADEYDEEAEDDEDRAAAEEQFDEEQPTVIVVMNETFSDLSIYENLHADYEGPTYFNSLSDTCLSGTLYVSAFGGGTANTEFEFLTGSSMAFLGSGVYPYTIYDLTETENLAQQFSDLGYDTIAMHPNHGSNWNRENVYEDLGFDEFLTIEDFEDADTLRGLVTDQATYDTILEILEEDDDPQFIFDVTMQNHSGYDTGLIPDDELIELDIDGTTSDVVNEYVSLVEQSDEALEYFIDELSQLDRKVILVFFGDHQPYFPSDYNDAWFTDEDEVIHSERLWQTDYIIWANYDLEGCSQTSEELDISVNYLGAVLMDLIGAPLTDYQKAELCIMDALPAINTTGYEDAESTWFLTTATIDEESASEATLEMLDAKSDLQTLQYYQLFGDGTDIYTKHYQSEANETDPNLDPGTTKIQ